MGEARAANPLVDQFRTGRVPKELRLLAAQGALPLKPTDLVELLEHLLSDREEDVHETAKGSLLAFPASDFLPILKDRETPPQILAWAFTNREERALRDAALQNHSTPDEAIEALAPGLSSDAAELLVINQVRLLRRTSLLEALESNASLNNDQRRRLRELRETFHIGEQPEAPPAPPPVEAPRPPPPEEEPVPDVVLTADEAVATLLADDERQQPEKVSAVQRLYRQTTADKVVTALKGSREERAILVRDPNRIVATAVLGSPRLTETEVESFASMRNLSSDILREIGSHKEWTRRYGVINALVRNPRTPLAISIGMVSRLNPRDIKSVSVDRNVPEVIRKQAQKFIKSVNEPRK